MTQPIAVKVGVRKEGRPDGINAIYKLSEPVSYEDLDTDMPRQTDFVWVSAVPHVGSFEGPETYIFPCTEDGKVLVWLELSGSFKGEMNHEKALAGLGFQIESL